jgi:hypothetical protein
MTLQQLDEFLMLFAWEDLPDVQFVRDQYQLAMEIIIWCRLYGFEPGSAKPDVLVLAGKFYDIDTRISDYWIERFDDIMTEYVKPANWQDYTKGSKLLQIKKYFEEVMQSMNKETDKIVPLDQAFIVHPPKSN